MHIPLPDSGICVQSRWTELLQFIRVRAAVITQPGPPDVLEVHDVPDPRPGGGEVLVDVTASAVNRADIMQRQGHYDPPPGASPYLGLECSGVISQLGDGVTGWAVGDEVCALLAGGGYAERVAAPAGQLMRVPQGISLQDAAALPEAACTVWSMVFDLGRLQPGETLLVHGGASGIGTLAIQLAHRYGARVITTARSAAKLDVAAPARRRHRDQLPRTGLRRGGRHRDRRRRRRHPRQYGGAYLPRNVAALGLGGRLVVLGLQGGRRGELDLGALLGKRASVSAASLRARPLAQKAAIVAATEAFVWPLIESGEVDADHRPPLASRSIESGRGPPRPAEAQRATSARSRAWTGEPTTVHMHHHH